MDIVQVEQDILSMRQAEIDAVNAFYGPQVESCSHSLGVNDEQFVSLKIRWQREHRTVIEKWLPLIMQIHNLRPFKVIILPDGSIQM